MNRHSIDLQMTPTSTRRGPLGRSIAVDRVQHMALAGGDLVQDGYLYLPEALSRTEVFHLRSEVMKALELLSPEAIVRDRLTHVRMAYGLHLLSTDVDLIARRNVWIDPVAEALGHDIYLYQSKLTINPPKSDAGWGWHTDFGPWHTRDSIPEPRMISAMVFLDDVGVDSGGLSLVGGSHRLTADGLSDLATKLDDPASGEDCWRSAVLPIGPAGSVVLFHALSLHGSGPNLSNSSRRCLLLTYNSCDNTPAKYVSPQWLCARDTTPLH